ncbi:hypothetical protein BJ684DRAFT_14825 [Piptocephalis cylindrospora]|uniref:Uncharacterized protein n=1 Tax=Piptocephalis cylindrospora TaxID=1907219 RepID=A0A4P9Y909_9FUNG|nr:hypothetical protein BJ684DRAFT_14825 [Piptocephalis cylindrospora]|eukprot:RKP14881.1 hypothetical protein BJ684DRAFT_14825 [Piptocephalis cylindrospora]
MSSPGYLVHGKKDELDQRVRGSLSLLLGLVEGAREWSDLRDLHGRVILLGSRDVLESLGHDLLPWLETWPPARLDQLYLRYIETLDEACSWTANSNLLPEQREWAREVDGKEDGDVLAIILIEPLGLCGPSPGSTRDLSMLSRLLAALIELAHDLKTTQKHFPQLWVTDAEESDGVENPFLHIYHIYLSKIMGVHELQSPSEQDGCNRLEPDDAKGLDEGDLSWYEDWNDIPWPLEDVVDGPMDIINDKGDTKGRTHRSPSL